MPRAPKSAQGPIAVVRLRNAAVAGAAGRRQAMAAVRYPQAPGHCPAAARALPPTPPTHTQFRVVRPRHPTPDGRLRDEVALDAGPCGEPGSDGPEPAAPVLLLGSPPLRDGLHHGYVSSPGGLLSVPAVRRSASTIQARCRPSGFCSYEGALWSFFADLLLQNIFILIFFL